jgi:hypothetical protein
MTKDTIIFNHKKFTKGDLQVLSSTAMGCESMYFGKHFTE